MIIEVVLEKLIVDTFPEVLKADSSGGRLADLVVAILEETSPEYHPYSERE